MDDEALRRYRDELRQRMRDWASVTPEPLQRIARLNAAMGDIVTEFKQRNGGKWLDGQGTLIQGIVLEALDATERDAIARSHRDEALRTALRAYFLIEGPLERYDQGTRRFDQLARLGDDASIELVFDAAQRCLATEVGSDFNPTSLFGLVDLARSERHGERARAFFRTAFDATKAAAGKNLVNDTCFLHLARCMVALDDQSLVPLLQGAFELAAHEDQHYEMNVAATHLAVYLNAAGYDGPLDALRAFCAYLQDTYAGELFTLRAFYALWMFERDGAAAEAYLASSAHTRSLGMAATACADLHHTPARAVLESRLGELKNAATREMFVEASARLREQAAPPPIARRMIWMHGYTTVVERALGADSDNVFELRAALATGEPVGRVFEVDDSTPSDLA